MTPPAPGPSRPELSPAYVVERLERVNRELPRHQRVYETARLLLGHLLVQKFPPELAARKAWRYANALEREAAHRLRAATEIDQEAARRLRVAMEPRP